MLKELFEFIKNLKGYWKLQKDYGYKPETYDFIIDNYEKVLCERTKTMSKPTYYYEGVVRELDRYYEEKMKSD